MDLSKLRRLIFMAHLLLSFMVHSKIPLEPDKSGNYIQAPDKSGNYTGLQDGQPGSCSCPIYWL
jgi:hypothetical protein